MEPLVYIVLVNYKTVRDTIECIDSLRNIEYNNFKVVVVENGSSDCSFEQLNKFCEDEIIINSKDNLGFAGGNNLGIAVAMKNNADYILLLNNDTIVKKNFLANLVKAFNYSENTGIVGCKINYYDKRNIINYAGGEIIWNRFTTKFYRTDELDDKRESIKEISFVSGCAMMIKSEVIKEIGMLDHSYFMYYEDTDYCAKASEAGFKLLYQPDSKIYHKISNSSGGGLSPFVLYWSTKNRQKFRNKFSYKLNPFQLMLFDIFNITTRLVRVLKYCFSKKFYEAKSIINGYIDGINNEFNK